MVKKIKEALSGYWFLILITIIGSIYFFSETRKISHEYGCDFDVVLNDWEQSELGLLKEQQRLITDAKSPPKSGSFYKQQLEDARKNLKKREYLKEADIREAEKWINLDKEYKEMQVKTNMSRQNEVNSCLQFISQKKVSKFEVNNNIKETTYNLFKDSLTTGGIILVEQVVDECYKNSALNDLVSCIVLDNYAYKVDTSFRNGMGIKEDNQFFSWDNFYNRATNNLGKITKLDEHKFLFNYFNQKTYEIFDDYASKDKDILGIEDPN